MKLNSIRFGLASSISASILWLICSVLVIIMPEMMMSMSGDMVHMELRDMNWHLSVFGVAVGMVGWFVMAGAMGWMLASIYNRLDS
tara:strand:- start:168 stop:425 length:258 start_codon:yes stop_codon:yes gene_type:complete